MSVDAISSEKWARNCRELCAQRDDLLKQVAELKGWKQSQMEVESEWDAQEVGQVLDLPLGTSIRKGILPAVNGLNVTISQLRAEIAVSKAKIVSLMEDGWRVSGELAVRNYELAELKKLHAK